MVVRPGGWERWCTRPTEGRARRPCSLSRLQNREQALCEQAILVACDGTPPGAHALYEQMYPMCTISRRDVITTTTVLLCVCWLCMRGSVSARAETGGTLGLVAPDTCAYVLLYLRCQLRPLWRVQFGVVAQGVTTCSWYRACATQRPWTKKNSSLSRRVDIARGARSAMDNLEYTIPPTSANHASPPPRCGVATQEIFMTSSWYRPCDTRLGPTTTRHIDPSWRGQ